MVYGINKYSTSKNSFQMTQNKELYIPIYLFGGFILFTEIFLFIGPCTFEIRYPFLLSLYLACMNISLFLGYRAGVKKFKNKSYVLNFNDSSQLITLKYFLCISALFSLYRLYTTLGTVRIVNIISRINDSILSFSEAYAGELGSSEYGFLYSFLTIVLSFIVFSAVPFGIYYWRKLPKRYKVIVVYLIFVELILSIGTGQRQDITNLIVGCVLVVIAKVGINKKSIVFLLVSISFAIGFFIILGIGRTGIDYSEIFLLEDRFIIKDSYKQLLPPFLYYPIGSIHYYLCHGYYNLSLIFDELIIGNYRYPIFTFGFGNSWALLNLINKYVNIDLMPYTYQGMLEITKGVSPGGQWHTIYPWIANDVSFFGCPFIIYMIGYFFAKMWIDVKKGAKFYAIPLLAMFSICVFWFFGNNQVNSFYIWSFWPLVFLYVFNPKKRRC